MQDEQVHDTQHEQDEYGSTARGTPPREVKAGP
jgi:hypothetical protein